jgi:hypothetical protein
VQTKLAGSESWKNAAIEKSQGVQGWTGPQSREKEKRAGWGNADGEKWTCSSSAKAGPLVMAAPTKATLLARGSSEAESRTDKEGPLGECDAQHNPDAFRNNAKHGFASQVKVVYQPRPQPAKP